MRRAPIVLILLCLCALPASALAQSDPFTPIVPQIPTPTAEVVTPEPIATATNPNNDQSDISRGVLFAVFGAIAMSFVGIGVYVTRDARRSLTESDRRALDREREGLAGPRSPEQHEAARKAKAKARAAGKRQRQARKAGRRR
jgi:hypothetical protein